MPLMSSRNHTWNNQYRNIPSMRNGIPEERRRLINTVTGNNEEENEADILLNREERRRRGIHQTHENLNNNTFDEIGSFHFGCNLSASNLTNRDERSTPLDIWENLSRHFNSSYRGIFVSSQENEKFQHIKQYNYIPDKFNFNKLENENNNQFFGIEIEIDKGGEKDENAKQILDLIGENNIYIKHDGSLTDGFEIVTHPCTYNYHVENMQYRELFKTLVDMGYKAHDTQTCGLHIHVNKSYFGENKKYQDLNISKLLFLVEKYWNNIVIFSRRDIDKIQKWAKRYEMSEDESMFDVLAKAKNAETYHGGKYHAVNLRHKDTIEFRMFKGTLKYETFIATLQLVKRLIDVVKNLSLEEIQLITWDSIFNDAESELKEYLNAKNLTNKN